MLPTSSTTRKFSDALFQRLTDALCRRLVSITTDGLVFYHFIFKFQSLLVEVACSCVFIYIGFNVILVANDGVRRKNPAGRVPAREHRQMLHYTLLKRQMAWKSDILSTFILVTFDCKYLVCSVILYANSVPIRELFRVHFCEHSQLVLLGD